MNPAQIAETTMDPANRTMIQLTTDDIEETLRKFEVIHGGSKHINARKAMMTAFRITKDDIDN